MRIVDVFTNAKGAHYCNDRRKYQTITCIIPTQNINEKEISIYCNCHRPIGHFYISMFQ